MIGVKFDQKVDIGELLAGRKPRHGFRPRPPRLEVACKASVRLGKSYYTVGVHEFRSAASRSSRSRNIASARRSTVIVESFRPVTGEVRWYSDRG